MRTADSSPPRRGLLRSPTFRFLAIGASLYVALALFAGGRHYGSYRIVLTDGRVDSLVGAFERIWRRPPTPRELRGLVDDYVNEEMLVREAVAAGLDRDDAFVLRRLRQKMEALVADRGIGRDPTAAELQGSTRSQWFAARRVEALDDQYRLLRARYHVSVEMPVAARETR
jgi:hypothetical protein